MKMISRRTVLRGAGVALALPWLEAMATASPTKLDKPPVRTAFIFMPNGVVPDHWTPAGSDESFELTPMLEPLANVKGDITLLENLWHEQTTGRNGHWPKVPAWLSGGYVVRSTGQRLDTGGVSIDQVLAKEIGSRTPLPSLELGIDAPRTGVDGIGGGFARIYGSYISWRDRHSPVAREIIPQLAFDRLFRTTSAPVLSGIDPNHPTIKNSLLRDDKSVLDLAMESAKSLQRRVGNADRAKIDEYLESVRSVERRITASLQPQKRWLNETKLPIDRPAAGIPDDHKEHVRLMMDVLLLAFWTDTTRISTLMLGDAQTSRDFSFLDGVKGNYHKLSHHRNDPRVRDQYERIGTWHVEQLAYLLERMKGLDEGGSSLLDNSMVMFGSSLKDGNEHNNHDLPIVVAGKAGGAIRSGRRIRSEEDTPMCNLYVTMSEIMGVSLEAFGDSNGRIEELASTN